METSRGRGRWSVLACIAIGSAWLAITAMGREDALVKARELGTGAHGRQIMAERENSVPVELIAGPNNPVTRGGEEKRVIQAPARAE